MTVPENLGTWVAIGLPLILGIGAALLLTLSAARKQKPDA